MSEEEIKSSTAVRRRPFSAKRLLLKLSFSMGVFLLCIAMAELVLHLMGYGNLEVYDPDPKLFWRLSPNQNCYTKVNHQPVRVNSKGTRGAEFQQTKPAGTFRILSLGDSRTFGWGMAEADTYSARFGQLLQQKFGNTKNVEVINAGVNGWSYPQMDAYLRDIGLAFHPDLVIVGEANGWTQFTEKSSPEFVRKFMRRVRLKNVLRRSGIYHYVVEIKLKSLYERTRLKFIPVDPKNDPYFKEQQQKNPQEIFRQAIEEVCALAISNHIQPVILYLPTVEELKSTNAASILVSKQAISRKLDIPLADPTATLEKGGQSLYLEGDLLHFNVEGNRIVAETLFRSMTNLPGI